MKTNSSSRNISDNKENIILGNLVTKTINTLAHSCRFIRRNTGKITPKGLIIGFMKMVSKQRNTYSDWATEIGLLEGETITKQALNERMRPETEFFVKKVVEKIICKQTHTLQNQKIKGVLKHFKHVQIEDSTLIHLPDALAEEFPGNVSRGAKKAIAKIHAMYNLTDNNFSFLKVENFSKNDQSLSSIALAYLGKGDLCIRDLGFLVLDVVEDIIQKGVYFISRKKYQTNVYDIETGIEIDLLKTLRRNKIYDKEVLIGKKQQLKVRLIAIPLSDVQANERRRKARRDRDKRLNHSEQYYELLGYGIYITNITCEKCSAENIFNLYKLRWNIEIIFKSWKSCFSLQQLIHPKCVNPVRVKCIIYLMLLYIYLFHVVWLQHCENQSGLGKQKIVSILKLASFFRQHFTVLITQKSDKEIIKQIKLHCLYDKRKDRDNAKQVQFKLAV